MAPVVAPAAGRHTLAEGPFWDAARERLLWVDIVAGTVHEGRLDGPDITLSRSTRVDAFTGAVVAACDGTLLVAGRERLFRIDPDGTTHPGPDVLTADSGKRLNDGGTDPAGRFLVGSLSLGETAGDEILVRVEDDGTQTLLDADLTLSNGLAWSIAGDRLYSADTLRGVVWVRDYDARTGAVGSRRPHLSIDDGLPDGIALDAHQHLWVAVWGTGQVRRFRPDGALDRQVTVPAPHVSSVAFAGPDLRTLVITTATSELTEAQLVAYPESGRLFTTRVSVPGAVVPYWTGPHAP